MYTLPSFNKRWKTHCFLSCRSVVCILIEDFRGLQVDEQRGPPDLRDRKYLCQLYTLKENRISAFIPIILSFIHLCSPYWKKNPPYLQSSVEWNTNEIVRENDYNYSMIIINVTTLFSYRLNIQWGLSVQFYNSQWTITHLLHHMCLCISTHLMEVGDINYL